ncbi:MAG TPA: MarR family transcriptional regulator [Solirubrobacteraceae bacterium]|nr:MarR family transcriptional regulator [Solirubrobacteraceae bacterium]
MTPTLTKLDLDTAARLRMAIGKLSRRLRPAPAAVAAGLTPTQISLLLNVARQGPIRLSDLAAAEAINPTQLSRSVAHLVDIGAVQRASDQGDRRAAWVKPTAAGRRLAEKIRRERTDALNVALADLAPDERRRIEAAVPALEHLAEILKTERS